MQITTRTIYGSTLQTNLLLGLPNTVVANTTLNELWNIHHTQAPSANERQKMEFYCMGNGGHRVLTHADGTPYISPINHRASDAGLYKFLPFVLRPVNEDLTPTEREPYGMRTPVNINGTVYWAYYLKRINLTNVTPEMKKTVVVNGVSTTTPFIPDNSNLTPTPPEIPNTGVVSTNGEYLSVTATVNVSFDLFDVTELINVVNILYDNENMAAISEIGLVAAVRKSVSLLDTNKQPVPGNYNEAIAAQIINHITAYYPVTFSNDGFDIRIELGATEPMLGPQQVSIIPGP